MKQSLMIPTLCGLLFLALFSPQYALAQKQKKSGKSGTAEQSGDKNAGQWDKTVIATIGTEKITYRQLEDAYRKNMNRKNAALSAIPKDSVLDFLHLYSSYRLKVQEALARKFDKDSVVLADIKQNRESIVGQYYLDKKITEPNVDVMLKRRQKELKVAVVFFAISQMNNDTLEAYKKAKRSLELIKKGEDFAKVARDSSEDAQSKDAGGVLAPITGGMILRELEDRAYAMKAGEIFPELIRTKYGYFILKLISSEPRIRVRGSHILVAPVEMDTVSAKRKADSIVTLLRKGGSFEELAKTLSDDKTSSNKAGDLGSWYSRSLGFESQQGRLVPEFEDALFSLKDREISGVVRTTYGFHIIRRDSSRKFTREDELETAKKLYKRLYFDQDKQAFLDSVKESRGFFICQPIFEDFISAVDTTKTNMDSTWYKKIPGDSYDKILYRALGSKPLLVGGLVDSLNRRPDMRGFPLNPDGVKRAINKLMDPRLMAEITANAEKEFPDFEALMREFRDGIMIFKLEDEEVWSKLKFDSVKARVFYDSTKTRYWTEKKWDISAIFVMNDTLAYSLHKIATKPGTDFDSLAEAQTQRKGFREKKGKWGLVSAKDNKLAARVMERNVMEGNVLPPFPFENGFSIVRVNAIENPRPKKFEEAIPDFAAQFQDLMQKHLLNSWIERLRQKYPVVVNTKNVNEIWDKKK